MRSTAATSSVPRLQTVCREQEPNDGALPRCALDLDASVMGLDDRLDDREAQTASTSAAGPRGIGPLEALKPLCATSGVIDTAGLVQRSHTKLRVCWEEAMSPQRRGAMLTGTASLNRKSAPLL